MLTMALGIALGAATLLVGNEVAKGVDKKDGGKGKKPPALTPLPSNSAQELEESFKAYREARRRYDEALAGKVADPRVLVEELKRAKVRLEKAILLNTPGLPSMEAPLATDDPTPGPRPGSPGQTGK